MCSDFWLIIVTFVCMLVLTICFMYVLNFTILLLMSVLKAHKSLCYSFIHVPTINKAWNWIEITRIFMASPLHELFPFFYSWRHETKQLRLNFCVFLALEITKLPRSICIHRSRSIESRQMNDFNADISFYTDAMWHY
jgi:hypothetical protein